VGSLGSINQSSLLAKGSTADIYAWKADKILKLFREYTPWHANEVSATKIAFNSGLPVPEVFSGLIEINKKEGIIFERIDGPSMTEYLDKHPDKAEAYGQSTAILHSQVHSIVRAELPALLEILTWSIQQTDLLETKNKNVVLDILSDLPDGERLCHNDFYPNNIIVSPTGPVIIDWAIGTKGNPDADFARTWLISKMWLERLRESKSSHHIILLWQQFWESYFNQYKEINPFCFERLAQWQVVTVTASLVWDKSVSSTDQRIAFINASLRGTEHPWMQ
jgi:tRNA A-37 threonylcarbamoyl transferase component Bud32